MRLTPPAGDTDHAEAGAAWNVTLVQYGDYECPACGQVYPVVKEVQQRLGGALRFVFRNFPLRDMHPHAEAAALLAEGAAAAGRFWAMHDRLYENQDHLDRASLVRYGLELGMSTEQVDAALAGALRQKIADDLESGRHSGVNGTPTFFVDGARFDGYWDANGLLRALRAAAA